MRMRSQATALLLVGAALSGGAQAQDLMSLYRAAEQNSAAFAAAQAQHRAGVEKATQGRALLLPQVMAEGRVLELSQSESASFGDMFEIDASGRSTTYAIKLKQTLYNPADRAAAMQARHAAELAELGLIGARQQLILAVAERYFAVLQAQDQVRLLGEQRVATERATEEALQRFEVGHASITDRHEAQAQLDALRAALIAAESRLAVELERLAMLTGEPVERVRPLQEQPSFPPLTPNSLDAWLGRAQQNSLQLRAQQTAVSVAGRERDKHRARSAPVVELVAQYGRDEMSDFMDRAGAENDALTGAIGIQLTVPLFTGGARSSQLREAVALHDKARHDLMETSRRLRVETRAAYLGVEAGLARVRALEQSAASSASRLEATVTGHGIGARTTLDVLNAQQAHFGVQRELLAARYEYLLSRLQLYALAGQLEERDLEKVAELLIQS